MTTTSARDHGFTLVELLVVIVVLGVLAAVVVMTIGDMATRGNTSSVDADRRILINAQEAYRTLNGTYGSETNLVESRLLRTESSLHDITINPDGSYTVVALGG